MINKFLVDAIERLLLIRTLEETMELVFSISAKINEKENMSTNELVKLWNSYLPKTAKINKTKALTSHNTYFNPTELTLINFFNDSDSVEVVDSIYFAYVNMTPARVKTFVKGLFSEAPINDLGFPTLTFNNEICHDYATFEIDSHFSLTPDGIFVHNENYLWPWYLILKETENRARYNELPATAIYRILKNWV